jgi:hypothetical protein
MRATYLGSNPISILIRCTCGRRLLFHKKTWEIDDCLRCDNCGAKICYKTLRVIPAPREGNMADGELEALREVEAEVRAFLTYFDYHVTAAEERGSRLHPFAPRTVETVEALRPHLATLDELRREETPAS